MLSACFAPLPLVQATPLRFFYGGHAVPHANVLGWFAARQLRDLSCRSCRCGPWLATIASVEFSLTWASVFILQWRHHGGVTLSVSDLLRSAVLPLGLPWPSPTCGLLFCTTVADRLRLLAAVAVAPAAVIRLQQ